MPVKDGRSIDEILASIMEGKEDHPEIFETLKNVARETPETGEILAESEDHRAADTSRELGDRFLCPVCETLVAADATVCPGCGAEFSEGEATEYECPVCKASVPADADRCPNCDVQFAEEKEVATPAARRPIGLARTAAAPSTFVTAASASPERKTRTPLQSRIDGLRGARRGAERKIPSGDRKLLYRELPKLVNEIKPLLVSAKRIDLEIEDGKRIINDAIQAGKGRDIERAVTLIADARRALDIAFVDFIGGRIDAFLQEIQGAKGDKGFQIAMPKLQDAIDRMEDGDYDGAWDSYEAAVGSFHSEAKDFHDARASLDEGDRILREVRTLGMDVRESERLLRQGRDALLRKDRAEAIRLGKQAHDRLKQSMPAFVNEEMRRARNELLDLKVKGNDLARPIGILKEASTYAKREAWTDALRLIRDFHKEVERLG